MLNYFNNRYRQKGFMNGVKGEFSLAAMKNLNPHSENKLVQKLLAKAEAFFSTEDVAGLFDTACYTNNNAVIEFCLDTHLYNLNLIETDKMPEDENTLPLLLSANIVIDGLMTAIEHGNPHIVKTLTERLDDWIYCQTDPDEFDDFTAEEYLDVQFYSPMLHALRQTSRHEETEGAQEVKSYLKDKYGIEADMDLTPIYNEETTKPKLTLVKGSITTPKDETTEKKPRPNYIKPV